MLCYLHLVMNVTNESCDTTMIWLRQVMETQSQQTQFKN